MNEEYDSGRLRKFILFVAMPLMGLDNLEEIEATSCKIKDYMARLKEMPVDNLVSIYKDVVKLAGISSLEQGILEEAYDLSRKCTPYSEKGREIAEKIRASGKVMKRLENF